MCHVKYMTVGFVYRSSLWLMLFVCDLKFQFSIYRTPRGLSSWPETTINYTMIYNIATMAIVLWSMSLGY